MNLDELINQFLEYLEVEKGRSSSTTRVYHHYLKRFSEWVAANFPQAAPEDINLDLVRRYRLYLARLTDSDGAPLKKVTQSYHIIALRAFLRYLSVQRDIPTLSPDRIELPKSAERTVTFLNSDQVERLLNSPDTSKVTGVFADHARTAKSEFMQFINGSLK